MCDKIIYMRTVGWLLVILMFLTLPGYCVRIDGKFWDWQTFGREYQCKPHTLSKDRSGLDVQAVRLSLGSKFLYVMVVGRSVTGQKKDKGQGFRRTSVRVSFSSAQSPLNRVRVLADFEYPGKIKISMPDADTKMIGEENNRSWASGRSSGRYAFELKIPVFASSNGIHVGSKYGPLIHIADNSSGRKRLSDMLINTVDTQTHRLVSTALFTIKPGDL